MFLMSSNDFQSYVPLWNYSNEAFSNYFVKVTREIFAHNLKEIYAVISYFRKRSSMTSNGSLCEIYFFGTNAF